MILSRELGKRIWGGSTNIENGGGGVSGDYIAGLLTGYAKESWVDEHYISIDFFSRLFQAHGTENGSEIDVMPNDMDTTITSVESMFGFWTNLYISALGSNGAAPAGISLGMLTDVVISGTPSAGQVLTFDAVTQKWVNGNAQAGSTALANLTDVTLNTLQTNQVLIYDATTQKWVNSSLKTINGYSLIGSGDIPASGGGSGNYLPLAGGTMQGNIAMADHEITGIYGLNFYRSAAIRFNIWGNIYMKATNAAWEVRDYYERISLACSSDSGNVGIGTSPDSSYRLLVNGGIVRAYRDASHGRIVIGDRHSSDDGIYYEAGSNSWFRFSSQTSIFISARQGESTLHSNDKVGVFVNIDGNVGIRTTTTTSYNLTISGSVGASGNGYFEELHFNRSTAAYFNIWGNAVIPNNDAAWEVRKQNGTLLLACDSNTNYVGIGISPSYKLHVSGTIYATGAITALSDARKKDITGEAGVTVEQIAHAPAVQFLWKDKERRKDGQQVGTLAQYWRTVLPEVVMDKGGELSMQYGVAALVSAIVTARKVVDHERRITELEKENERLRTEVEQLRLN